MGIGGESLVNRGEFQIKARTRWLSAEAKVAVLDWKSALEDIDQTINLGISNLERVNTFCLRARILFALHKLLDAIAVLQDAFEELACLLQIIYMLLP